MKINQLSNFWGISPKTLRGRKTRDKKQFQAFELGTFCLQKGLTQKDLDWLADNKFPQGFADKCDSCGKDFRYRLPRAGGEEVYCSECFAAIQNDDTTQGDKQ